MILGLKRKGSKWVEVADQGNELKSLWAQWESPEVCNRWAAVQEDDRSSMLEVVQVVILRTMTDIVLEMMHDLVTAGHKGIM